jgi:hypothetical protein
MSTSHPQGTAPRRVRYHTGCSAVLLHRRWFNPPGRTPTCRLVLHASGGTSHRKRSLKKMASSGFSCPTKPVTCLVRKASRIAHLRSEEDNRCGDCFPSLRYHPNGITVIAIQPRPHSCARVNHCHRNAPCPLPATSCPITDVRSGTPSTTAASLSLSLSEPKPTEPEPMIKPRTSACRRAIHLHRGYVSTTPALGPLAFRPWTPSRRERRRRRG